MPVRSLTFGKAAALGFAIWSASSMTGMAQEKDGKVFYMEFCASCHGANLEGQPDWRQRLPNGRLPAPPHDETGHTWHHSDEQLFRIVKEGLATIAPGYETDMPAYAGVLDDAQIEAILDYIKGTWPHRERDIQQSR